MNKTIKIEELVDNIDNSIIIDLRSPVEFEKGAIKGAINIPLLDNEMRALIGTIYSQDRQAAYQKGLEEGTKVLPLIYKEVIRLKEENPDKQLVFYCFRGGTRSSSVVEMINMMKVKCLKLESGYKGYRKYILENIDNYIEKLNYLVVSGNTGSGKTIVLNKLEAKGIPILDLEGMANHRGSVFGEIGLDKRVTQKNFEDELFYRVKKLVDENVNYVYIESESKKIGKLSLPASLYNKMQNSEHILLEVSVAKRTEIINDIYNPKLVDKKYIIDLIKNNNYFLERLGNKWIDEMIALLEAEDYKTFISKMLVDYYDKLYGKSQKTYKANLTIKSNNLDYITNQLVEYIKER